MLRTLILVTLLGYVVPAAVMQRCEECAPPPPPPKRCHWAKSTPSECCPSKLVCEEPLTACRSGAKVAKYCPDSLCDDTTCKGHPHAKCLISRCGGCSVKFYKHDELVKCAGHNKEIKPICPYLPVATCENSPCMYGKCKAEPSAPCRVDFCQPCTAVFHDENNKEMQCSPSVDTEPLPDFELDGETEPLQKDSKPHGETEPAQEEFGQQHSKPTQGEAISHEESEPAQEEPDQEQNKPTLGETVHQQENELVQRETESVEEIEPSTGAVESQEESEPVGKVEPSTGAVESQEESEPVGEVEPSTGAVETQEESEPVGEIKPSTGESEPTQEEPDQEQNKPTLGETVHQQENELVQQETESVEVIEPSTGAVESHEESEPVGEIEPSTGESEPAQEEPDQEQNKPTLGETVHQQENKLVQRETESVEEIEPSTGAVESQEESEPTQEEPDQEQNKPTLGETVHQQEHELVQQETESVEEIEPSTGAVESQEESEPTQEEPDQEQNKPTLRETVHQQENELVQHETESVEEIEPSIGAVESQEESEPVGEIGPSTGESEPTQEEPDQEQNKPTLGETVHQQENELVQHETESVEEIEPSIGAVESQEESEPVGEIGPSTGESEPTQEEPDQEQNKPTLGETVHQQENELVQQETESFEEIEPSTGESEPAQEEPDQEQNKPTLGETVHQQENELVQRETESVEEIEPSTGAVESQEESEPTQEEPDQEQNKPTLRETVHQQENELVQHETESVEEIEPSTGAVESQEESEPTQEEPDQEQNKPTLGETVHQQENELVQRETESVEEIEPSTGAVESQEESEPTQEEPDQEQNKPTLGETVHQQENELVQRETESVEEIEPSIGVVETQEESEPTQEEPDQEQNKPTLGETVHQQENELVQQETESVEEIEPSIGVVETQEESEPTQEEPDQEQNKPTLGETAHQQENELVQRETESVEEIEPSTGAVESQEESEPVGEIEPQTAKSEEVGHYCVDGETWKDGCADCQCVNGFPTCFWVGCGTFQVPEGIICNVRPGTENDCCPKYDCEEVESHCVDKEGKEYAEGEQWKEGCEDCECSNGIPSCKLIPCALFMPPEGTQCKVRPGTENDCCPQFDCEEVENHCVDKEGKKYADGEKWKEGKCGMDCQCSNGVPSCYSKGCSLFTVGLGVRCKVRPGTEEDCCPQHDCEQVESYCVDKEGKEYADGEKWKEGCVDCECSNGIPSCKLIPCALFMPPEGTQCKVRPGTENDCCPQFDCEDVGSHCVDKEGNKYAEGEKWKDGCAECECLTGFSHICKSTSCPIYEVLEGSVCKVRPGTEEDCCPQYDCEEVESHCVDKEGKKYADGEKWKEGCVDCECSNGIPSCKCALFMPPEGCKVRPGTENGCCPQFDCEDVGSHCVDKEGNKYAEGEKWKDGCAQCECLTGFSHICKSTSCPIYEVLEGSVCKVRPGTEEDCCPQYDCEEVESHCVDKEGKKYADGEKWKEGCVDCECSNGIPSCKLIPCALFMPPEGTQCKVRPGTENDCCPQFDCEDVGSHCVDKEGNKYAEGEKWKDGCAQCECLTGFSHICKSTSCPIYEVLEGSVCKVRPGTEEDCCPQYDCEEVENHCVDKEGKKYADGEKWKEGKCGPDCQCSNGVLSCYSSGCSIFLVGEGTQCKIRPGTEEDCCPQYDCEEAPSNKPCIDANGNTRKHREEYFLGKCDPCVCIDGIPVCAVVDCVHHPPVSPFEICHVRPRTEDQCCPEYDCIKRERRKSVGANQHEVIDQPEEIDQPTDINQAGYTEQPDIAGIEQPIETEQLVDSEHEDSEQPLVIEHTVGEQNPSSKLDCSTVRCKLARTKLPPLCRSIVLPGECCADGMVCEEPLSDCPIAVSVPESCPDDLCLKATCESHPEAKCIISRCGGCFTKFFDDSGTVIEECSKDFANKTEMCPPPPLSFWCISPPCAYGQHCKAYPDAICHSTYCSIKCGLPEIFHDKYNNEIKDCSIEGFKNKCEEMGPCEDPPEGVLPDNSLCRWIVQPEECCPRDFGPNGFVCEEPISACGDGVNTLQLDCPDDLCQRATCENHPGAKCKISHCGKCHTVFYDNDGNKVDCGNDPVESDTYCPRNEWGRCSEPACPLPILPLPGLILICPRCFLDWCDSCKAYNFDAEFKLMDCDKEPCQCTMLIEGTEQPVDIEQPVVSEQEDSEPPIVMEHSVGQQNMGGIEHQVDTEQLVDSEQEDSEQQLVIEHTVGEQNPSSKLDCSTVRCKLARTKLPPLCRSIVLPGECCADGMVCEESLSKCPIAVSVPESCPDDLCLKATCESHPEAKCIISRCGGCFTKFFDDSGTAIEECNKDFSDLISCPPLPDTISCVSPPCAYGQHCKAYPDAICHSTYCSIKCGLPEIFHDKYNNEIKDCSIEGFKNKCEEMGPCEDPPKGVLPMFCRWIVQPEECCPRDFGPNGFVCEEPISACGDEVNTLQLDCPDDLCQRATCENHPGAKCKISHCGKCHTVFYNCNGNKVDCGNNPVESDTFCPTNFWGRCAEPACPIPPPPQPGLICPRCFLDWCDSCKAYNYNAEFKLMDCNNESCHCIMSQVIEQPVDNEQLVDEQEDSKQPIVMEHSVGDKMIH
ncbi:kielin/chordin-like protein isoform X1 [Asterias rubens]|uniref:kielin/chordin-like protein isoform X1 n=1 Tax=Asterias rubens TaxID=7604 RepID=UPI0014557CE5|nr:kielin/chordin-like protein isoform X1 [Asterias rubens]